MTGELSLRPELRAEATASVVLSATMLAMPAAELHRTLLAEQERNPALLVRHRPTCHRCHRGLVASACPRCGPAGPRLSDDPVSVTSAWEQLRRNVTATAPRRLVEPVLVVLTALDERGLLTPEARQALLRGGMPPAVLVAAVRILRDEGPPGIAAATPAESLVFQLDSAPFSDTEKALARRLLTVHAEWLADGDLGRIASIESCDEGVLERLVNRMRRLLRPYPGLGEPRVDRQLREQPPDLSFEAAGTRVRALVVEREALVLSVDTTCGQVHDARSLISRVHRRWSLLQCLGDLLAAHHGDRLLAGSSVFRPLTRAQAALLLTVHESTVSRAVAHRTASLVTGEVVTLASLFGSNGDAYAAVAELCAATPRPSDREVALVLAGRGIVLSRRTVAKYRQALDR